MRAANSVARWFRAFTRAAAWLSMWSLAAGTAAAGTGSEVHLPLPRTKIRTGLALEINAEWLDGNGYRPVRIRVSPLTGGPAAADRRLLVRLRPRSWQWGQSAASASAWVELSQGDLAGEVVLPVPQSESWGSLDVETFEDGRKCEDLSADGIGLTSTGYFVWSEAAPAILIIDGDAPQRSNTRFPTSGKKEAKPRRLPDIRTLGALFLIDRYGGVAFNSNDFDLSEDFDDNDVLRVTSTLPRLAVLPPASLPSDWINYTGVDLIVISLSELEALTRHESWPAMRAWLATGPTLCVYGVGENFERLSDLERLLELATAEEDADPQERGWIPPTPQAYASEIDVLRNVSWSNLSFVQPNVVPPARKASSDETKRDPPRQRPFLFRNVEFGRVVALAAENPFPGQREDWCWLFNTLSHQDWMWYQRHGLSLNRDNADYWNLLIPGVGSAPVNSFLVLISLFVIVIGPVNYFLLQRRRRLYLLLVTVPLGAGLVTLMLLLYALFDDGLGVRVRPRSVTKLDQASGRVVTWSRQSYYAGLAPSAGMSFPRDAAVYPIDHRPRGNYGQPRDFRRRVDWGDTQRLSRGYLNSRSTSQLLVVESRLSDAVLVVDESPSPPATPRVTNRLGVEIEQLVLRDSSGRLLGGNRLPPGQTIQLHELDAASLGDRWGSLFRKHRPQLPVGLDPNQMENAAAIFGPNTRWWNDPDQGLPPPSTFSSILERRMNQAALTQVDALKPRNYVAIARGDPEMSLGVKSASQEASFHVILGNW